MERDRAYLVDMLVSARLVLRHVAGVSEAGFLQDVRTQDAVIRRLEIVGEASRRVSEETRAALPRIPWARVAGMRNLLIHQYDDVDLTIVWDTVQRALVSLVAALEAALGEEPS